MHGRVKIKTSEEMQAIRRKEEQEKARVMACKMDDLLRKKKNEEYDDEIMALASDIIYMNPDVLTAWNARKERFLAYKSKDIKVTEDQVNTELKLTEVGLRINPKSYCAWHHRCWILDNFADQSAWSEELTLCSLYLEKDDRNFHCWDYRRHVVEKHGLDLEKELTFCKKILNSNFSNYSAWHYCSKLLPQLPVFKEKNVCSSSIYKNEISRIRDAVYTDPDDQSAWFYQRWLLGHIYQPTRIVQHGYSQTLGKTWVVIYPKSSSVVVQGLNDHRWEYLNGDKTSHILVKNVEEGFSDIIKLYKNGEVIDIINTGKFTTSVRFKAVLNEHEEQSLREQLASYEKLVELELKMKRHNKWARLASIIIREKLGEKIDISDVEKLITIDNYRENYYSNMICRYKIEAILEEVTDWYGSIDLSNKNLNAFYHSYYFTHFKAVDLSNNPFGNDVIPKLAGLFSCETLNLSNCKLTSIDKFPSLPKLHSLKISKNEIKLDTFPSGILQCSLKHLDCTDTLISSLLLEVTVKNLMWEIKY